ncbi:hypothetical protein H0H81_004771, partial [Sphagnurus paluster]
FGITNVEVEYRESLCTQSAGVSLLLYAADIDITDITNLRRYFTTVLGLSISAEATPHCEGTGGVYLYEDGDSKNILLVTAHHVVLPLSEGSNDDYTYTLPESASNDDSMPLYVMIPSPRKLAEILKSIEQSIDSYSKEIASYRRAIEWWKNRLANDNVDSIQQSRGVCIIDECQLASTKACDNISTLENFLKEFQRDWGENEEQIIGHAARSPPIAFGAGEDEDVAIIKLDRTKLGNAFNGNVMDLGTKITDRDFAARMNPRNHAKDTHTNNDMIDL